MITETALQAGRRMALARMTSLVLIERPGGEVDPLTGEAVRSTVYEGRGRVATYEAFETDTEVSGATVTVQRYSVHVPVSAGRVQVGDVVTVVDSPSGLLVGNTYRVAGTHEKNDQTAQRLLVDHI